MDQEQLRKTLPVRLQLRMDIGADDACWPWTGSRDRFGYGRLAWKSVPRLVYAAANDVELGPGMVIRHTCDNPPCCNPQHLIIGTVADNVADRVARGRSARGIRNGRCKLSVESVRRIKRSRKKHAQLAREHGVDATTIRDIRRGKIWKGISPEALASPTGVEPVLPP